MQGLAVTLRWLINEGGSQNKRGGWRSLLNLINGVGAWGGGGGGGGRVKIIDIYAQS